MKKNLTPNESLKNIETILNETQSKRTGASFYYVLWGIVLFIYFFLNFIISSWPFLHHSNLQSWIWIIFPVGGILSVINKKKDQGIETVVSHYERVYFFAFSSFAMSYGFATIASFSLNNHLSLILFPMLLGITVYVVGGITKHTASIVGGLLGVLLSVLSIFSGLELQFVFAALAALFSSLIPGILMKNRHV
ncbi:MAG: hypothetical protein RIS20_1924 [Bacteroidota bacterium]|jgi:hypothetical protein